MVIKDVYLYALLCFFLKEPGKLYPCFIVPENIELEADEFFCIIRIFEDCVEGVSPFIEEFYPVAFGELRYGYFLYGGSVKGNTHTT